MQLPSIVARRSFELLYTEFEQFIYDWLLKNTVSISVKMQYVNIILCFLFDGPYGHQGTPPWEDC